MDPESLRVGETFPNITNSFLCLLVNIPILFMFLTVRRLFQTVGNTLVYVLHQTFLSTIINSFLAVYVDGEKWNTLSDDSIWGWL